MHSTASPSPEASANGLSTSSTEIMTGTASARMIASSVSIAAHMPLMRGPSRRLAPEQHTRLADRDDRSRDQHPTAADRAFAALGGVGHGDGTPDRIVEPRREDHPLLAEDVGGQLGELGGRHRAWCAVLRADD